MLATAIVVFRETLEAALVIGIILAATRGIPRRAAWIGAGVAAGIAGACVLAAFAGTITMAASGLGQELLSAAILGLATVMLGWHVLFMARHGRELAREARELGAAVSSGERPMMALAVVTGLTVLREGAETVLFLYGIVSGGEEDAAGMVLGGLLGAAAGAGAGALLYAGLVRLPVASLFRATNGLIVMVAAGMAAQAAGFLIQADLLPALASPVWDTSRFLSEKSVAGQVLHSLAGYEDRPAGMQVVFYAAVIAVMLMLTSFAGAGGKHRAAAAVVLAVAVAAGWPPAPVRAAAGESYEIRLIASSLIPLEGRGKGEAFWCRRL